MTTDGAMRSSAMCGVADWVECQVGERTAAFVVADPTQQGRSARVAISPHAVCVSVDSLGRDVEGVPNLDALSKVPAVTPVWLSGLATRLSALLHGPVAVELAREQTNAVARDGDRPISASLGHGASNQLAVLNGAPLTLADDERSLTDVLARAARGNAGITFVGVHQAERSVSYAELWHSARCVAAGLRGRGVAPQQPVILQLRDAEAFITAFWGCVLAGAIPVPCAVPQSREEPSLDLARFSSTQAVLGSSPVVTDDASADIGWVLSSLRASEPIHEPHRAVPGDLALLLLTSGSTGAPRLVRQTHSAVLSRSAGSVQHNHFGPEEVSLNWFPLDHVGGLLMFHVHDVFARCQQIQAPLSAVLAEPTRWLDWIERFRVTVTWAPNFAFALLASQREALARGTWDLSSLKFILNGGEPIVARHAQRFIEALQPHKLRPDAMHPAWGMTETCSGVTYSSEFGALPHGAAKVPVGLPIRGVSVRIVDDSDRVVSEGEEGHLQVRGAPVTDGYHLAPDATAAAFSADGWYRTGDRGVVERGALSITGRHKDVVIVNGLNISCADVEAVVEEVSGVRPACAVAMAFRQGDDATDSLVIVFVPGDESAGENVALEVASHVLERIGIRPYRVLPVAFSELPRTSIGKIQRPALLRNLEHKLGPAVDSGSIEDLTMEAVFRRRDRDAKRPSDTSTRTLVLCHAANARSLASALSAAGGAHVLAIAEGQGGGDGEAQEQWLSFSPNVPDDYRRVIASAWSALGRIDHIVHALACDPVCTPSATTGEDAIAAIAQGCASTAEPLLFLMQALSAFLPPREHLTITLVTEGARQVLPADGVRFGVASAFGILKTAATEYGWLRGKAIDFDRLDAHVLAEEVVSVGVDDAVAYRNGKRWVSRLQRITPRSSSTPPVDDSLVMITGGLGGVGFEVARHLLSSTNVKLLIVGRTPLPASASEQEPGPFAELLLRLHALERLGTVAYSAVDITRSNDLEAKVCEAEARFGVRLRAAFHLALELAPGKLDDISANHLRSAVRAKCLGAVVVRDVLERRPDTTLVAFSSVAGHFGGSGFGAYAGACSLLDALGDWQRSRTEVRSVTIAFSAWKDVGLTRRHGNAAVAEARGFRTLNVEEALSSLSPLFASTPSRVLVGLDGKHPAITALRSDLPVSPATVVIRCASALTASLRQHIEREPLLDDLGRRIVPRVVADETIRALSSATPAEPAPASEHSSVRCELVRIWRELLELDEVRDDDNFFDLGGHSLVIPRAQEAIRQALGRELPAVAFFKYPTLAALARHIEDARVPRTSTELQVPPTVALGRERAASAASLRRARGL